MERGNFVAGVEFDKLAAAHAVAVQTLARAQDVIFLLGVDVSDLQVALDAVKFNRNGVEVVAVVLLGYLDVNGVPVKHGPDAAEVVGEDARIPVGVYVGVAALDAQVAQLTVNARKQIHLLGGKLHEGIAVLVKLGGRVFQLRDLENFLTLRRRSGRRGCDQGVAVQERNDIGGELAVNQIVIQKFLRNGRAVLIEVTDESFFVAAVGMETRQAAAAVAIRAADFVNDCLVHRAN